MQHTVTVVIPARNCSKTIERAAESALESGADYVYIFNDASTDHTEFRLEKLYQRYNRVQVFGGFRMRSGCSFARNFLIAKAPHGLIVPLDADDELQDLRAMVEAYEPGVWCYGDWLQTVNGDVTRVSAPPEGMWKVKPICFATMLFHQSDWIKVGGYNTDFAYAEDYSFQTALATNGIRPKKVDCISHKRYIHTNERTHKALQYWHFYHKLAQETYHFS